MRRIATRAGWAAGVFLLAALTCRAQQPTVNLWPGVAPGSENWKQKEQEYKDTPIGRVVINVVTPTLTAYLPEPSKATGTAVIIAPGGAFVALSMDLEGYGAAKWLQERGIAAFLLKYRVMEKKGDGIPPDMDMDEVSKYGIADGVQAIKVVRQHAKEWGVAPDRIVFLGFSAGAMVTSGALLQKDPALRPNFAAPIYGAPFGKMPEIPDNLPPIFMAWAQNDPAVLEPVEKFYEALLKAGNKPEAHIYSAGGHGFGTHKQGTTSDHWIDEFYWWMEAQGLAKSVAKKGN